MKVIDISSHQTVEAAATPQADAVIVKATQGYDYVNPKCNSQYSLAKQSGKLVGLYHYAEGRDPIKEADFFVDSILGYIGEATLWLDWESGSNQSWGNSDWCIQFINRVHFRTNVYPGVYIQASALPQAANVCDLSALWIAGYPTRANSWEPPAFPYSTNPWEYYTIWQFTDAGGLDKNVAKLDAEAWKRLALGGRNNVSEAPVPEDPQPLQNDSLEGKASCVALGVYGNGQDRVNALGQYYTGVQAIIDHRAGVLSAANTVMILKNEVLAGKYGDGAERVRWLGTYYQPVQDLINRG